METRLFVQFVIELINFQTQNLLSATSDGGSVVVPGQGWIIFGGNNQTKAQRLTAIGQAWEEGPAVQQASVYSQCVVQVSLTKQIVIENFKKKSLI